MTVGTNAASVNMQGNNVVFNGTGIVQVNGSAISNYTVMEAASGCDARSMAL